eukprot:PhM_4_TR6417/c0_g1_i1/m.74235
MDIGDTATWVLVLVIGILLVCGVVIYVSLRLSRARRELAVLEGGPEWLIVGSRKFTLPIKPGPEMTVGDVVAFLTNYLHVNTHEEELVLLTSELQDLSPDYAWRAVDGGTYADPIVVMYRKALYALEREKHALRDETAASASRNVPTVVTVPNTIPQIIQCDQGTLCAVPALPADRVLDEATGFDFHRPPECTEASLRVVSRDGETLRAVGPDETMSPLPSGVVLVSARMMREDGAVMRDRRVYYVPKPAQQQSEQQQQPVQQLGPSRYPHVPPLTLVAASRSF